MASSTSARTAVSRRLFVLMQATLIAATMAIVPAAPVAAPAAAATFGSMTCDTLAPLPVSENTGEKPQSKAWKNDGAWWAVLPTTAANPGAGTWLWKLNGTTWASVLKLSDDTNTHADVLDTGSVTHVLLYSGTSSELISVQYAGGTYALWATRPAASPVTLDAGVETATIALDSDGRMWLASDAATDINVRWSDSPYSTWSAPITLATGTNSDDISVITAFNGDKVGVLWSNQATKRFGFKVHADGAAPATWGADELPASQSADDTLPAANGMADDHLNLAVASDGTIYAAVKTSYDTTGYPKLALLVRRPAGTWDDLYGISESGTRGIVLLNEADDELLYVATSTEGAGNILVRTSPTSAINFGASTPLMSGSYNEPTSTKQTYNADVVVLASSGTSSVVGRHCTADAPPANTAPVAVADGYTTAQDTAKVVTAPGVLGNDTDADAEDTLTATKVADPAHGTVIVNANGGFTYTPEAGYSGADSFTYKANDGEADSNTATVSLTVTPAGPDTSLVGWWKMDEAGGTTVADSGALPENTATTVGNPTRVAGQSGNALLLNGSSQYATTSDEASLDMTGDITVAAWIKPESVGTEGILKKGVTGGTAGYELSLGSSGKVFVRFNGSADYRVDSATSYPVDGNTWVHVAGTYDGTTIKLYYNGVSENPKTASFGLLANSYPISIGVNGNLTQYFFDGAIDDVRVYNRALTAGEIAALADAPPANTAPVAVADGYTTAQDTAKVVTAPGVLGNDTDADAEDTLTATKVADPAHGTVIVNANGGFTYTPEAGYSGADSFTYKANDGEADSNTATVSLTVTPAGPDTSLVGWWKMDGNLTDSAPAAHLTTGVSGPTFGSGMVGQALVLNGTSQYATTPDATDLDITGDITIAAWVRPDAYATQDILTKVINGGTDGYQLTLATTKADASSQRAFVRFNQVASGDAIRVNAATMYPIDGTWQHVAATYDGATIKLYIDGELEGSLAYTGAITSNATPIALGGQSDGTRFLDGALDDVRLYNRALSAAEIAALADVTPGNQAPVCAAATLTTAQDTPGDTAPSCTDGDGDTLTYAVTQPANGTASVVAGQLHYVPDAGYSGPDLFTYTADDGTDASAAANVTVTVTSASGDVVMVGAGDIADSGTGDTQTAALINALPGATVVTMGDSAYPEGTAANFADYYQPTWGAFKARTYPSVGNHDWANRTTGYFPYFGARAASPNGWYSYDQGAYWHVIVLNTETDYAVGSAQEQWLRADLAANTSKNVLAYFHRPRFSSDNVHGTEVASEAIWDALYEYGADLVLNGHAHWYERFAPQTPDGVADPVYGIRQITAGTGGGPRYSTGTIDANSLVRNGSTWGVVKVTLKESSYDWEFVPVAGGSFTDSGTGAVHDGPPPITNPGIQFDGSNDYVTFGTAAGLGLTTMTLETWFKRTGTGVGIDTGTGGILSAIPLVTKGRGQAETPANVNMNYFLGIDASSGRLVADFEDNATGLNHAITANTVVTSNVWHHAAATYDGATWRIYLDGVLDGTAAVGAFTPESTSIQHAGLGAAMNSSGTAAGFFAGVLDEARIWNVARTQAQIQATQNQEITSGTGLVARWGMGEGTGTTIASSVGTFPGTLTNGPTWTAGFVPYTPQAPVCSGLSLTTLINTAGDVAPSCTDANGDPLTDSIVAQPAHGTASVVSGQLRYVPATGYTGPDTFTYKANDGGLDSNTAAVTVTVLAAITNYGIQLNGTSQYVTFGPAPALGASTLTLETWFKRTGTGTATSTGSGGIASAIPLVTKGRSENDEPANINMNYFLGIDASTGVLVADFEDSATGLNHPASAATAVTSNAWHHAAATYDGTTWRIYLDGVLDGTTPVGAFTPQANSIQHAGLGTAMNSTGVREGYFAGVIDEARIWNVARSGAQILASKNLEITVPTAGLLGRWGLNEGSGTTAVGTATTNTGSHNGTYSGATLGVTGLLTGDSDTAVTFNGTDEWITVADSSPYRAVGTAAMSFEAWFNHTSDSNYRMLATCYNGVGDGWELYDYGGGGSYNFGFGRKGVTGGSQWAESFTALSAGRHHAVATYDGTEMRLYLDTVLIDTQASAASLPANGIFIIGGWTGNPAGTAWNGTLDEVAFFDYALSSAQVATHHAAGTTAGTGYAPAILADTPVAYWRLGESGGTIAADSATYAVNGSIAGAPTWVPGFVPGTSNQPPAAPTTPTPADNATGVTTSPTLSVNVAADPDGDPQTVSFFGRPTPDLADDPFTFVVLPDTQNYSKTYQSIFTAQTQWIVADPLGLDIEFVSHLGDIVDSNDTSATEWTNANTSMSVLDAANVPYSVTVGNHDGPSAYTSFLGTFPASRYAGESWYGGYLGDTTDTVNDFGANRGNLDSYQLFSTGGRDFLVLNLEVDSPAAYHVPEWADAVLTEYSGRTAIVVTHEFVTTGNSRVTSPYLAGGTSAETLWQNVLRGHCNVVLVVNGHDPGEGYLSSETVCGRPVHQLLSDYQNRSNGGDGWLRYYTFTPSTSMIEAHTYRVAHDAVVAAEETDANSRLSLAWPAASSGSVAFTEIGTAPVGGGSASIAWPGLANDTAYEWYAVANDGTATTPSATWSFTTGSGGPTTPTISGTVTAGGSGVAGAIVYVFDAGTDAYVGNTTTGAGGAYTVSLAPGTYKLWIQTNTQGYPDQAYGPDGSFENATPLDLATGSKTADVVLAAASTRTVSGTVSAAGTGVAGAIVYAFDAASSAYVGNAFTTAGGAYTLALPAGTYKLWVQTNTAGYPDQAYGPDGSFANATPVDLTAGHQTANVVLAATISGTVTAGGSGVAGAIVYVFDEGTDAYVGNTTTGAGGAYTVSLAPGTYKLWIQTNTQGYPDQAYGPDGSFENATPLDLATGSKTADVVLAAASTRTVSGTVSAAGTGVAGAIVYAFDAASSAYVGNAFTTAGGAYTLALPAGTYKLWVQTNTAGYPDQAYGPDGSFANATPVDLTAGHQTANVVLAGS